MSSHFPSSPALAVSFCPSNSTVIVAPGLPLDATGEEFFYELLRSKGHSKIDVATEIADAAGPLASFQGSYVVQKE